MTEDEDTVVMLDRPIAYLEPDDVVEDAIGDEEVTAEYVLAHVDLGCDEVLVEDVDDVILLDVQRLDLDDLEVA